MVRDLRVVATVVAAMFLAVLLLPILLPRPAHAGQAALERARRRGFLIVGVPLWLPPFAAASREGAWQGLDVALGRAVAAAALGSPFRVHFLPLTASEWAWAVQSGAADLVAAPFVAPVGRGRPAPPPGTALVGPYYAEPLALLVRRGHDVRGWRALDGAVVAVAPGSRGDGALRTASAGGALPVLVHPVSAAAAAFGVAMGRYRALLGGLALCQALAARDPELSVQTLPALGREAYWVLLPAAAVELVPPVRAAIASLPSGPRLRERLAAWGAGSAEPPAGAADAGPALTARPPGA